MSMIIKSLQSNLSRPIPLLLLLLILITNHASAQPSSQSQDPYGNNIYGNNINPSVGIIIIALVVSLFLLGFFSIYVRHCSGDSSSSSTSAQTLRLSAPNATRSRGLDASVIQSFPTFDYSAVKSLHIGKGALECAVCLNEFEDDETLRLIPKCDHVFHPDCIDAWLVSHTTCPVCRADLTPQPGDPSFHAPVLTEDDVTVDVAQPSNSPPEPELMERPMLDPSQLNRSRTRRTASGRPGWLGILFTRSNSTGHVAVRRWEDMERFTLRLPEEVRSRIISGSLMSSRVGPVRAGPGGPGGEGSSRGRRFGSWRFDRAGRSERWGFSLAPPFFTRGPSVRSTTKVAAAGGGDSVHDAAASETNLPPV